jgi:hypothetical protein
LRNNTKGYGGKTHYIDSQNRDTTAPSGRELYHLQFSLQAASPETFGYTLVINAVETDLLNSQETDKEELVIYLCSPHTPSWISACAQE